MLFFSLVAVFIYNKVSTDIMTNAPYLEQLQSALDSLMPPPFKTPGNIPHLIACTQWVLELDRYF
jgi:hypothetical protein